MSPSHSASDVELSDHKPPRDPRNVWRVIDALGTPREVASEGNAQKKAAGYDYGCPARECPHRVQRWNGSQWVDVERTMQAFGPDQLHDAVARIDTESDFGNARSYEWLRDVALLCFNPADEDGGEEEIIANAMVGAVEYILAQPCTCKSTDPDGERSVPYGEDDQCDRCEALGRYFNRPFTR